MFYSSRRAMFMMVVFSLTAGVATVHPLRASGEPLPGFKTPSNNIFCMADSFDEPFSYVRCDIMQTASAPPRKPRDCELDWGNAFSVGQRGPGERLCHGDTARDDGLPVLPYGSVWRRSGFSCTSEPDGLTCVNAEGHGFMVSRAVQRLF